MKAKKISKEDLEKIFRLNKEGGIERLLSRNRKEKKIFGLFYNRRRSCLPHFYRQ